MSASVLAPGACVQTTHGPVLGYSSRGVQVFKGLPYAGSPEDGGRWLRAGPPTRWQAPRGAYTYGPVCPSPQGLQDLAANEWVFLLPRGAHSAALEDCLRINLWAPGWPQGLDPGARRPVMLWLHGQGFMAGSSQDFLATEGENLARTQDIVVASINHRVGPLGHLHLGHRLGEAYADSGNAGMLDIVDALRWLRDNVASFGGDPGNVTVFGQSGGGFKLSVLLAMPQARGLFHRAIIQSGARLRVHSLDSACALADATLERLGLGDVAGPPLREALQRVPVPSLLQAAQDASAALAAAAHPDPGYRLPPLHYWMPVAGVPSLPGQPFDPQAPSCSSHVPLLVGTTLNEASPAMADPAAVNLSWTELPLRLQGELGALVQPAIDALRRIEPAARPVEVLSMLQGRRFRQSAVALCDLRCGPDDAPVFNYLFRWCTPQFEGRPGAFHTGELPFVFANAQLCAQTTGGGASALRLAERMSAAWASFARHGRPDHADLPPWPAYHRGERALMVFDDQCRVELDPDRALREVLPA